MGDIFERYFNDTQPKSDRLLARWVGTRGFTRLLVKIERVWLAYGAPVENRRYGRLENPRYDNALRVGFPRLLVTI